MITLSPLTVVVGAAGTSGICAARIDTGVD